jgi:hypothetical protein
MVLSVAFISLAGVFLNAFIPNIEATIRFRTYSPGVMTAILISLRFLFYLYRRALNGGILNWTQFWILIGIAPLVAVIFVFISLQRGTALDK